MPSISARAPQPNKRKGRAVAAARPDLSIQNISAVSDTTTALRLQRLALLGLSDLRASLVAELAWGKVV